jgi:hypothetical protein
MAVTSTIAIPVDIGRAESHPPSSAPAAGVIRPTLYSMLRRIIDALADRWERKASERAIRFLRTRRELSADFRNELERRFMGQ